MACRALDANYDWIFGQSPLEGLDALRQEIQTRLLSWYGDCFFDPTEGVDYNSFLEIGTKSRLLDDIRRVLSLTDGVTRINSISDSLTQDRRLHVEFSVSTKYGLIDDSIVIGGTYHA